MAQVPATVVVTATPAKDHVKSAFNWTVLLSTLHLTIFACNIMVFAHGTQHEITVTILQQSMSFLMFGICLPLSLYRSVKRNNTTSLRVFVLLLTIVSLLTFVSCLAVVCTIFELDQLCEECSERFVHYNDTCEVTSQRFQVAFMTITADDCETATLARKTIVLEYLNMGTAFVGLIAACQLVTPENLEKRVTAEALVLDEISVIAVDGEVVAVRTEDIHTLSNI